MKKRIISGLLVLCLVMALLPAGVLAAPEAPAQTRTIALGTSGLETPTLSGTDYQMKSLVYFGAWEGKPIGWLVLDASRASDKQTPGAFLLSEKTLADSVVIGKFGDYHSGPGTEWHMGPEPADGDHSNCVPANDYHGGHAEEWCLNFANNSDNFGSIQKNAMLGIEKTEEKYDAFDMENPTWRGSVLTSEDKAFFLSAQELYDYVGTTQQSKYFAADSVYGGLRQWWLRSPNDRGDLSVGVVFRTGTISTAGFDTRTDSYSARPGINLNTDNVLFTSAIGAKAGAGDAFKALDTYELGRDESYRSWNLTLLDSSRSFRVNESAVQVNSVFGMGIPIPLTYSGAVVDRGEGTEFISGILTDESGAALYYGRLQPATSEAGVLNVSLPQELPDGSYTLYLFNEHYTGGEDDSANTGDYASALQPVSIVKETSLPELTEGTVRRDSDTQATVTFTTNEPGKYWYVITEPNPPAVNWNNDDPHTAETGEQTITLNDLPPGEKLIHIRVADEFGNVSQPLVIPIPAYVPPTYLIAAEPTALDFGAVRPGASAPAQTVTVTNTGNQDITLAQPTSAHYTIGPLTKTLLAPGDKAEFTVQPNSDLATGVYHDSILVQGDGGAEKTNQLRITLDLQVTRRSVFIDVHEDDWFFDDVMKVYDEELMIGTSENTFTPGGETLRSMVATVLWRMEGRPVQSGADSFADTRPGQWYSEGVLWAENAKIAKGYGNGNFGPDDPVTREQLAAFFYRYCQYKGYDLAVGGDAPALSRFQDGQTVSDWARQSVEWAVDRGVILGTDEQRLDPQKTTTRAEFAAMLSRFMEIYGPNARLQ